MIRNVCIHVSNEQPLLADLFALPSASDAGLLCTNVRSMDGTRPVFIDSIEATFFFPYHVIRFLEIPEGAMARHVADGDAAPVVAADAGSRKGRSGDAGDGDARGTGAEPAPEALLPIAMGAPQPSNGDGDLDIELEIDEGFLQRVRDI